MPDEGTDTGATDSDRQVGGLGRFSHSKIALVHQHWIMQVLSAGGFNVHCTQGAEAAHKIFMKLASLRVKHGRPNETYAKMSEYLKYHLLFESVWTYHKLQLGSTDECTTTSRPTKTACVRVPLRRRDGTKLTMGSGLDKVVTQRSFLHNQVRLTRAELLDLLCAELELPTTMESYRCMEVLRWTIGQKLLMPNVTAYWATDDNYLGQSQQRRDVFLLDGSFTENGVSTAFCCQATCFITISKLDELCERTGRTLPVRLRNEIHKNSLTFVLARWLTYHNDSWARDSRSHPICPGPLQHTHCLWTFAKTRTPRKMMVDSNGNPSSAFRSYSQMFGDTTISQMKRWNSEKRAYYGLVTPRSIMSSCNISREYEPTSMTTTDNWLEVVSVLF